MRGIGRGVFAEERGGVARDGQRLRVADRFKQHVERIGADIADRADTGGILLDKCGAERRRNAVTAAAARLEVIDIAQLAGIDDLLDHLHVFAHARLEADGQKLAARLFRLHDGDRFIERHGERLFEHHVDAVLQRVDGAGGVLAVIGADADGVELLGVDHGAVVRIIPHALDPEPLHQRLRLARHKLGSRNNLYIIHLLIFHDMRFGNPAGADDADTDLLPAGSGETGVSLFKLI